MANTFRNAGTTIGNTETLLYSCPSAKAAVIHSLFVSNLHSTIEIKVTLKVHDSSRAAHTIVLNNVPVPVGGTLSMDKLINLESLDQVLVSTDTPNYADVFASIVEVN